MTIELISAISGLVSGAIGTYLGVTNEFRKREQALIERIREHTSQEVNMRRDYAQLEENYDQLSEQIRGLSVEMDRKFEMVYSELKELRKELKN